MSDGGNGKPLRFGLKIADADRVAQKTGMIPLFGALIGGVSPGSLGEKAGLKAGDIVTCIVPPHLPHIMIVSDRVNRNNIPLVIHNIGSGAQEEDLLFEFQLTGHYRIDGIEALSSDG